MVKNDMVFKFVTKYQKLFTIYKSLFTNHYSPITAMVGDAGFEPATPVVWGQCSTAELIARNYSDK